MTRSLPAAAGSAVLVAALAACGGQGTADPSGQPPVFDPGAAVGAAEYFGTRFSPCTNIELEGYPGSLQRASGDYYQGPWCGLRGNERIYLWAYARPLSTEQTVQSVSAEVVDDGHQLVLDLLAQGYARVCGEAPEGRPVDVGFERPDDPSRVRVITAGSLPQQSAAADGGVPLPVMAEPLSLQVVLSPSQRDTTVPDGAAAPPC